MSKKNALPSTPRHIQVYDEDWAFLEAAYGRNGGARPLGISVAIRAIIHSYVMRLRANAASLPPGAPGQKLDMEATGNNG